MQLRAIEVWETHIANSEVRRAAVFDGFDASSDERLILSDVYEAEVSFPERPAKTMSQESSYRHELSLRDEQIRRELDLRQESFRAEQAARDKALDDKFSGFFAAQAERDKRLDGELEVYRRESRQIFQTLTRDIDRLGSIKANIWGAMVTTIVILVAVGALALTAFQAGAVKQPLSVEAAQPTDSAAPALAAPAK